MAADRTESESGLSENELAERENNENAVDDNMYRAISRFLTNREQSYEEFLNGFTHLTTEDVAKYQQSSTCRCPENNSPEIASDSERMVDSTRGVDIHCEPPVQTACQDQNDLEEEVLEDLPHTSMMTRLSGQPTTHTLVKFDNFVEDCGGSEDDEPLLDDPDLADLLGDSSYSASFSENGSRETTLQNTGRGVPPGVCPRTTTGKSEEFETETNFGEVEANSEYTVQENQTCLELTSTDDNLNPSNLKAETLSDEVETFQLDPDFDYDNIKLTPKYSADDLRTIMQTVDAEH